MHVGAEHAVDYLPQIFLGQDEATGGVATPRADRAARPVAAAVDIRQPIHPENFMRILVPVLLLSLLLLAAPHAFAGEAAATNAEEAAVLEDSAALNNADLEALMSVLAPSLRIYKPATEPHTLVGPLSERIGTREKVRQYFTEAFRQGPQGRHEVVDMVSLGELVLARVEFQLPGESAVRPMITGFRVRDGRIDRIWHIARFDREPAGSEASQAVIDRFNEAADRNDVETFLSLFAPDARNFHFRGAPDTLGGAPSKSLIDAESRGRVFRTMFAERPARIEVLDGFALGEWVVSRDRATQRDGSVSEGLSLYRVQGGRIVDDWFLAQQARPPSHSGSGAKQAGE